MENRRLIAIDGNSLINRAFYALPPLMTKSGLCTNGVYGFINMMNKVMTEYKPEYITVAFDLKAPTFRHIEYSEYKAGRKKTPFELLQQFPLLKDILKAMNINILEMEGFEADDLIGTVVKRAEEAGLEPYVITGDKDALQLASKETKIIITKKGITEFDVYDDKAMLERYHMTPEQFIDLKGLMGDSSDNIPGVPGIGEKTGITLIEQFGSIENLLNNTDKISKPKLREKLEENAALAVMSRRLSQINTNVPIETDFEKMRLSLPDRQEVVKLYKELELFSLIGKIDKTWQVTKHIGEESVEAKTNAHISANQEADISADSVIDAGESNTNDKDSLNAGILNQDNKAGKYDFSQNDIITPENTVILKSIDEIEPLFDKESFIYIKVMGTADHVDMPIVFGAAICFGGRLCYLEGQEAVIEAFKMIHDKKIGIKGHLLKDDYYMLKSILPGDYAFKTSFDTGIAQYVLEPQRSDYSVNALGKMYFDCDVESEKDFYKNNAQTDLFGSNAEAYAEYCREYINISLLLEPVLTEQIKMLELEPVYFDIELPLIEIFADMESRGFCVDKNALKEIGVRLNGEIETLRSKIYQLAGEEFNINSPKQLGVILFEKLNLSGAKKTKTGYSTSADVLEKIAEESPIVKLVLEYRTLSKLNSTYVEGLTPLISSRDGKIRAHFQQTGTATGRISCTEPNLQNIPIRQELGRTLRRAFVAEPGCVLVDADYSQIELRVLAHMSQDSALIETFKRGADIHRSTAARVFEVAEDEVTPLQRSSAKAVNFGVIYGISGFGLSENLHITRKEAEKYIKDYFEKHAGVRKYMDDTIKNCKELGYVTTLKGRRRTIPEIKASNFMQRQFGERLAMNTPIQGTAADIIKIAMILVYKELKERGLRSKLILQVHDELIINTYAEEEAEVKELLKRNMMAADSLAVPLEVGMDSGKSWYDVK